MMTYPNSGKILRLAPALVVLFLFIAGTVTAQTKGHFTGVVKAKDSGEPLPGAEIVMKKDPTIGAATDLDGKFSIDVSPGSHTFVVHYTGMTTDTVHITIASGQTVFREIDLTPFVSQLGSVEIKVGRYAKNYEEVTVTMDVIKAHLIQSQNARTVTTVLDETPGLNILDGEAQIRGGSGFTFGVGSKVAVFVDDMPLITGDAGRVLWDIIPTGDIDQIEVVKGASSVLSGANALSGAIYFRSAYPSTKPATRVTAFGGFYSKPKDRAATWWTDFPYIAGANFLHSEKFGHLDLVIGGDVNFDHGYLGPPKPGPLVIDTITNFTNRQMATTWGRINFNLRYRSKKIQGLNYGINGNIMKNDNVMVLAWLDDTAGFYRAYPGAALLQNMFIFYFDPFINFYSETGVKHSLRTRVFYNNNDMSNNQSVRSTLYYADYQFHKKYKFLDDFEFTGGLTSQYATSLSTLYTGSGSDFNTFLNLSAYGQIENNFYKMLYITVGGRLEYYKINDSITDHKPIFRIGGTLKLFQETYLRASWGQGYRFPTIAERYIKTALGAIAVFDNPDLVPESSTNAEIGVKQAFKFGKYFGYIDLAFFRQDYRNTIEYLFGFWDSTYTFAIAGFRFVNTGRSRITGIDLSVTGTAKIGSQGQLNLLIGYNYILPKTLEPDYVFARDYNPSGHTAFSFNSTSLNPGKRILKYRFLHTVKADIEYDRNLLAIGFTLKYFSRIENLDKSIKDFEQATLNSGGTVQPIEYMDYFYHHNNGNVIMDARVSYKIAGHHKVALICQNITNRTYSLRPLKAEQMRTVMLQYTLIL
jgi:outer membrane receptor protein involved in Fe transport